MSDNFASLGPSLLARKGGAKPAMRRQVGVLPGSGNAAQNLEDLGWNDMGEDADDEASASHQRAADVLQLSPATAGSDDTAAEEEHSDTPVYQPAQVSAPAAAAVSDEVETALDTPLLAKKPNVLRQQEEIAQRIEAQSTARVAEPASVSEQSYSAPPAEEAAVQRRSKRVRKPALERGKRAAFTLRLDAERHLKLRLACTLRNRSAQQLVTEALDQLLGQMNDVDALAAQVRGAD